MAKPKIRQRKVEHENKYMDICERVRDVRMKNRLTQAEFAEVVGMSQSAIAAIEVGLYTPNFDILRIIKRRFITSYDWVIDGEKAATTSANTEELQRLRTENEMLRKVVDKLTR